MNQSTEPRVSWAAHNQPLPVTAASMADFVSRLRSDLAGSLPGPQAQSRMAPRPRPGIELLSQGAQLRSGGVLVLFYPHRGALHLPLILRATYSGVHSGQVSLPGGRAEENDPSLAATALREAHEEIGVSPDAVTLLGGLTPLYVAPSNFLVHPFVGWTAQRPDFRIDSHEVAQLIEAPLAELLDPAQRGEETRTLRHGVAQVPFFTVQQQQVWGATAMILSELLSLAVFDRSTSPAKATPF